MEFIVERFELVLIDAADEEDAAEVAIDTWIAGEESRPIGAEPEADPDPDPEPGDN